MVSVIEAGAELERRLVATAILAKARKLSKGQHFLLSEIARYHPQGFSTEDMVKTRTLEILHERFGYLDRTRVDRQDVGEGKFVLAYWLYKINDTGRAALDALKPASIPEIAP